MEVIHVDIVIVGAGIAGLATAVGLRRVGLPCLVLERSTQLRTTGAALALWPNAWRALLALGVAHKLTQRYQPFKKGTVTSLSSGETQYISFPHEKWSHELGLRLVHRKALLEALVEELPSETIRFNSKLSSIDKSANSSQRTLHLEDGNTIVANVVIGCDGVQSAVAQWLGLAEPVHCGRSALRSIAVFPEGHGFVHEFHQLLGRGTRAGFIPLNDTEIFWFLTYKSRPQDADIMKYPALIQEDVLQRIGKDWPPKYVEAVRKTDLSTLTLAPLMFRQPWNLLFGSVFRGNVTVAGDAMHPMTPDIGQGGCAALEDAVVLVLNITGALHKDGESRIDETAIEAALENYVKERRLRAAGLITRAFLSGWVQGEPGWLVRTIRDKVFYKHLFSRFITVADYDCGELISARN